VQITDSGLTYADLTTMVSGFQRFTLGNGFLGSIKNFQFYHGSFIFQKPGGPPNCSTCDVCHSTYPFIIVNATLKNYLNPSLSMNECVSCSYPNFNTGSWCSSSGTCGTGYQNFISNTQDCEYCGTDCKTSVCKDGVRNGLEVCDDGLKPTTSGCTDDCSGVKSGYSCQGLVANSMIQDSCNTICGDGITAGLEQCDILNNTNYTGCQNCKFTQGYYCIGQTCTICKGNCQTCSNTTTCQTCLSQYYMDSQGNCVNSCPNGYYGDSNMICQPCRDVNCLICTSSSCQGCNLSWYLLSNGNCSASCPLKTYISSGKCLGCNSSYCDVCTNQTTTGCSKCNSGKFLSSGSCVDTCGTSQYPDTASHTCVNCPTNCQTCANASCTICNSGGYLKSGGCVSSCGDGYVLNNVVCQTCDENYPNYNCTTCNSTGCTACQSGTILTPDLRCSETCPSGYFNDSSSTSCKQCPSNCQNCVAITNRLLSVISNAINPNTQITGRIAVTTTETTSKCTGCVSGYFLNNTNYCVSVCESSFQSNASSGTCVKCQVTNCDNCDSDVTNCDKCLTSYLYRYTAQKQCLATIPTGYYLLSPISLIILACNSSCVTCNDGSTCLKCNAGYLNNAGYCLNSCPTGYYNNSVTNNCDKCNITNCDQCDSTLTKCLLCANGYYYEDLTSHSCMQSKCGDSGYYYNLQARTCTICTDSNCIACNSASNVCDLCGGNYSLFNLSCVTGCSLGFGPKLLLTTMSFQPNMSTSVELRTCQICQDTNCVECDAAFDDCQNCKTGLYLLGGICVNKTNYTIGFYVSSDSPATITECPDPQCNKCSDYDGCCNTCNQGFLVTDMGCNCTSSCGMSSYQNSNGQCVNCPLECQLCYWNTSINNVVCTQCSATKYLLDWKITACDDCPPTNTANVYSASASYYQYTQNGGNQYCGVCPSSCITCNSLYNCTQCVSNSYLYNESGNFSCVGVCPDGTYLDQGSCRPCTVANCSKCAQVNQCTQCLNLYLYVNTCVSTCPDSYYLSTSDNTCKSCNDGNCKNCINNGQDCNVCIGTNVFLNGACVSSCGSGYYLNGLSCAKCMDSCLACNSSTNCTTCNNSANKYNYLSNGVYTCESPSTGFYVDSITFILETCMKNCQNCNSSSTCTTPSNGYYYYSITGQIYSNSCPVGSYLSSDNINCLQCAINCTSCTSASVCTACNNGFVLNYDKICSVNCSDQYSALSGICYQCPNNSKSCVLQIDPQTGNMITISVTQCQTNFYLQDNMSCVSVCPSIGYYKNDTSASCLKCLNNCDSCTNGTSCSLSSNGFYLTPDGDSCITQADCLSKGLFIEQSTRSCKPCTINNCDLCSDLANCKNCSTNFLLYDSGTKQCVSVCPDGYYNSSGFCSICQVSSCKQCNSSQSICNSCLGNNILSFDKSTCSQSCSAGFVSDSKGLNCLKCGDHCTTCANEVSNLSCITPDQNFYLLAPSTAGIIQCPVGYYFDTNRLCIDCSSQCLNCSNSSNCTNCNVSAGFYLDPTTSQCVSVNNVQIGYYVDNTTGLINKCTLENCTSCVSQTQCDVCKNQYFWDSLNKACVMQCPDGFGKFTNSRQNLPTQYLCKSCNDTNCKSCDVNQTICQSCLASFMLVEGKAICTNNCSLGYFDSSEECLQCSIGCAQCTNSTYCNQCDVNFMIFEGSCLAYNNNPDNATLSSYMMKCPLCLEENYPCPNGAYKLSNGTACERCSNGCVQCKYDGCVDCVKNLTFINGSCFLTCGNFTYLNESSNTCDRCICFCKKCSSFDQCETCDDYFSLNDEGLCQLQPGYFVTGKCCPDSTYFNQTNNLCENCSPNCLLCTSYDQCQKCTDQFVLTATGYCQSNDSNISNNTNNNQLISPPNQKTINIITESVQTTPNSNNTDNSMKLYTVIACPLGCSACLNQTCTNCYDNYTYLAATKECLGPCSDGLYRDLASKSCKNCSYPCQTCSLAGTNCTSCPSNLTFLKKNFTCHCPKGEYIDNKTSSCLNCSANCEKCHNSKKCGTCYPGYEVVNNTNCYPCSEIVGLGPNCTEICGDGYLINSLTSGQQCDDGNKINGDGCSSTCQIEAGWNCDRNNSYTPDVCYNTTPYNLAVILSQQQPETIIIQPYPTNRKIMPKSDQTFQQLIIFTIPQLNYPQDYNYAVHYDNQSNCINIMINYSQTVQNIQMSLILVRQTSRLLASQSNLTCGLCDEFNVDVSSDYYEKPFSTQPLFPYKAYDQNIKDQSQAILNAETTTSIVFIVTTGPLYIFQAFSMFWLMVECIQISYFLQYVNVDYTINLEAFLKILQNANLNFLPNIFAKFSYGDGHGNIVKNQKAPKRFNDLGLTSSFLMNAGSQMLLFSVVFCLFIAVIFMDWYFARKKIGGKIMVYTKKIRDSFEYGLLLRVFFMVYMQFCLGSMLQIRNPDFSNTYNGFSSFLGFVCFLILIGMFMALLKVINSNDFDEKADTKKFRILYGDYNKETWMQKNYPVLNVLKKFLMIFILVMLHDFPKLEILFLIMLFFMSMSILILTRPFKRKLTTAVMIVTELAFVAIFFLIGALELMNDRIKNDVKIEGTILPKEVMISWLIIIILCGVFSLYFIIYFRQQLLMLRDLYHYLQDFKVKYNEYMKELAKRGKFKRSDHLGLLGTIFRGRSPTATEEEKQRKDEILDAVNIDPKLENEQIEEKYLDLEKMPESSFSAFYKKFKSAKTLNTFENDNLDEKIIRCETIGEPNSEERKTAVRDVMKQLREKKIKSNKTIENN